jgi:DNA repair protein RecN (Recombination protein N)
MLRLLTIKDFVIVDRLELEFGEGFTVLTGETGAGKSILVDAVALALGERGDAALVRQGAKQAEISAEFEAGPKSDVAAWLREQALEGDPGVCLMRRVIDASGRSRGFINGHPVTLAQLREAGEFLIDIHGQHEHQSLGRAATQRELLDAFGGLQDQAVAVAGAWRDWQRRRETRIAFETNAAAFAAERERLEWQLRELDALNVAPDEWETLGGEHTRLAHAASLIEAAQQGLDTLSEDEGASLSQVNAVVSRLTSLIDYDPGLREILDVLEPAQVQLQEAVYALRRYGERVDVDPQRLREVEARIDAIHSAARKYRTTPESLPRMLAESRARLDELAVSGDAETLLRSEEAAREILVAAAKKLSAGRAKAAKKLSTQVTQAMQDLAMAGGSFAIELIALDEPSLQGAEQVEFRVSAHKGLAAQPLAKVASGGELSRLSLAIQTALSQVARVPTLIFDEVDAGIGGRVAEIVGRMLRDLGRRHQVMCITHLPQVAAAANQQLRVIKDAVNGAVRSKVTILDAAQRVEEVARMLGGVKITETTRKHAAEMLSMTK